MIREYKIGDNVNLIKSVGFNGWVNFDRREVHFCPRCNHLDWLEEIKYYDGTVGCALAGVVGNSYALYENGGAKITEYGPDVYDHYYWAAVKFGWYQFVDETPKEEYPTLKFVGPVHGGGKEFANLIQARYRFKSDHNWPDRNVRNDT